MTVRLAFIGCGTINRVHANVAQKMNGVELTAVVKSSG